MSAEFTPDRIAAAKAAILVSTAKGTSFVPACSAAGVSKTTAYEWIKADPAFAEDVERARLELSKSLEDECCRRAMNPDDPKSATLLIFALKNKARWSDNYQIAHSGEVTARVDFLAALVAAGEAGLINSPIPPGAN